MNFNGYKLYFNFGYLLEEWKEMFSRKFLLQDLSAGVTVAFIAIPLSLAIALASGVSPGTGLITAIIAGIVCAVFGGTPLAVSGPAAAMAVIVASNVQQFGVGGLALICLVAGLMQLISGLLGLGKFSRYVPLPVIAGFTAGIGVIIMIGQLPRIFGLLPPAESRTFQVFAHLHQYMNDINLVSFGIVVATFIIIKLFQKFFPRLPGILIAVLVASVATYFLKFHVPLIGAIPRTLPEPSLPWHDVTFGAVLFNAFAVYVLASLETLLSSTAVDKLTNGKKHDSNQELIGQGLGNIAVSLFSGMPVTGVIARSAVNVRAGAKTRRSSIIHALIILAAVYFVAPIIELIPIAALAGVLFSVALSMISYREFHGLWVTSRAEAMIYAITFLTIIFVDLIAGIQAGIIAAGLIVLFKATKTHLHVSTSQHDNILRMTLSGALTFLSVSEINELEKHLETNNDQQVIILDLSSVNNMDSSGATAIVDLFNFCSSRHLKFYIKGLARRFESLFKMCGGSEILNHYYLITENDLKTKEEELSQTSFRGKLIHGVQKYYNERKFNDRRLYEYLAAKQNPHTLFITCADSRIIPSAITSSDPGELFIVRNVGNFIPPHDSNLTHSEAAALDFALASLDIADVVVCGHVNCGAMQACASGSDKQLPPSLKTWIDLIKKQLNITKNQDPNEIARNNVLNQIQNLKTYPIVQKRLDDNTLTLHAWFFDFDQNLVYEWQASSNEFEPIVSENNATESETITN